MADNLIFASANEQIKLFLNSIEFTNFLDSFQLSYSSADITSGISYITGTIRLTRPYTEKTISLDPRFANAQFTPGAAIKLTKNNTTLPLGSLYVINSNYDFKTSLTLDVGCLLATKNNKTSEQLAICIEYGAKEPIGNTIVSILLAAGIKKDEINIKDFSHLNNYFLIEPLILDPTTPILSSAAALAGQFGTLLYTDIEGKIALKNLLVKNEQYWLQEQQENSIVYTISSQPEQAVGQINLTYNKVSPVSIFGTTSNLVKNGEIEVSSNIVRDDVERTVTTTIKEYRNAALVQTTTIFAEYETQNTTPIRDGSIIDGNQCYPQKQSRLLKKTTITKSDNTEVLKNWLAYKQKAANPTTYSVSGVITSAKKIETYDYGLTSFTYTSNEFQPAAKVVPIIGDAAFESSNLTLVNIDPLVEISSRKITENYIKNLETASLFTVSKTEYVLDSLIDPTAIKANALVASYALQDVYNESTKLRPISNEILYNQSLPDFETYDENQEIASELKTIKIGDLNLNVGISETLSLGDYGNPDTALIKDIGENVFSFKNGRIFGCLAGFKLDQPELWPMYTPFALVKIKEQNGYNFVYKIDSPAVIYSETELTSSFSGSLLGTTESNGANYFKDEVLPLPSQPKLLTVYDVEMTDIVYTIALK